METTKESEAMPMKAEPEKEHEWLQKLVGEWTYRAEAKAMDPGGSPMEAEGTESVRSLGGLWILAEGRGEMPDGSPATTLMTLGYDPGEERYTGTWIGSMMTHLWVYDGALDADEKVLTLEAEGPAMTGEGTAKYRDVIEVESADRRVLRSLVLGDDGEWHDFMTANYRRTE